MKNRKILNYIIPIIYFLICLTISFHRIPFWDEARAWLIAQNCNVFEFLDMMKLECHLFVWYLIISPFAKLNLFYPYSIYVLNTLFATGAIFCLFKYSPFKLYEKLLITFSTPFLFLWGSVARCYSIGILLLFIALCLYKERFKKPYLYFLLLCLSANTSVMSFIGAFFLMIIFMYEIRKEKFLKNILFIFSFLIFVVLIQVFEKNPDFLHQEPEMAFLRDFFAFILRPVFFFEQYKLQSFLMSALRCLSDICAILFICFCVKNNKKTLFFILLTYISIAGMLGFFYSGNFWHYFFFYLYFIVAFWILKTENELPKTLNICFCAILICCIFKGSFFIDSKLTTINNSTSKYIAYEILNNSAFQNRKLFCLDPWSDIAPSSLPYLKNKLTLYDINNDDRYTYKSMRNQVVFNKKSFDPDEFCPYVEENSVLLTTTAFTNHEKLNKKRKFDEKTGTISFVGSKCDVDFIPYVNKEKIHLWSYIIKVNKKS